LIFLLDANVVSERIRRAPDQAVLDWIAQQRSESLFVSTVTVAEVQFGVSRLDPGGRRDRLEDWIAELIEVTGDRLLPVDVDVATAWGRIRATAADAGRPLPIMNAFIAATAEVHSLTVVTRNVRDFEVWGGPVFNPWVEDPPA